MENFGDLVTYFTYDYVQRALFVGVLVASSAALLGVTLVLKRLSMIGDGLSHVGFGAMALALVLHWAPIAVAMPVVMVAAFFLLRLGENSFIKGDVAVAMISGSSLALGLLLAGSVNVNINSFLFGSILAMGKEDAILGAVLALMVLGVCGFCYHTIFAITFDEEFVHAVGAPIRLYKSVIGMMVAVIIVVGMRIMGALLISSLIIFPGVIAMRVCGSFWGVMRSAVVISVVNFIVGMIVSIVWNLQPGASIVLVHTVVFVVVWVLRR
ncbi:MAG: metal ABC transporter permease [Peptococcaceae bacterium]|nr:metal ABC transporter permease [Peptococcaceae bacterium]